MFNKLRAKPKEHNGTEKAPLSKKSNGKQPEVHSPSSRTTPAVYSVPIARRQNIPDSPQPSHKPKMSRESSCASIVTHNRVKSYVSYNDSTDRSVTSEMPKNVHVIERLKTEIQDLRIQYQNDITMLRRENYDLQLDVKKTKREMHDLLQEHSETLKTAIDQLDVEMRMLSKSIFNIQNHYTKLVPFLLNNLLLMMKNHEYLENRINHLETSQASVNNPYKPQTNNYCQPPCSCTYSISIYPISDDEEEYYKLVFNPVEEICQSKFSNEAREHVYAMPANQEKLSSSQNFPQLSLPSGNSTVHRRLLLGSKAIPYYLKRLNNLESNQCPLTIPKKDDGNCNCDTKASNTIILSIDVTKPSQFKDLKKRYLKRRFRGLRSHSYPCIKTLIFGSTLFKIRDDDNVFGSQADFEQTTDDSNLLLCQSETDLFQKRLDTHAYDTCEEECYYSQIPTKTVIYRKLNQSIVEKLLKLQIVKDKCRLSEGEENLSNEFTIILSRSKLGLLMSHNFADFSCEILSNSFYDIQKSSHNHLQSRSVQPNMIDDSDYFTYFPNNQGRLKINLASVETLSDNASFIDDDYFQQALIHQTNSSNCIYDSYDNLCTALDHFALPRGSVNNIFNNFKN